MRHSARYSWQVESGMKLCSWLVGFLTIWLASQSDMKLCGKFFFFFFFFFSGDSAMWAGNLIQYDVGE